MNSLILTAKMVSTTTPLTITQSTVTGNVTVALNYDANQFSLSGGALTVSSIPQTAVYGLSGTLVTLNNALNTQSGRIDALETGSIDLSNYATTSRISLETTNSDGINLSAGGSATVKVNGQRVVTSDMLSTYMDSSLAGQVGGYVPVASDGYADADYIRIAPNGGLSVNDASHAMTVAAATSAYLGGVRTGQEETTGLIMTDGTISVSPDVFVARSLIGVSNGVAPLNANGKLDRAYLGTLNIQETYSVTLAADGTITIGAGQNITAVSEIEIGDAVILSAEQTGGGYAEGTLFYRTTRDTGKITDFSEVMRDLASATTAEVTIGEDTGKYITPAALKNAAPTILGSNITGIPGSGVALATSNVQGTVKVQAGNGLTFTAGTVSMGLATSGQPGAIQVGSGMTVSSGTASIALNVDTSAFSGNGGASALGLKTVTNGGLELTAEGLRIQYDTNTMTIGEDGKLSCTVSGGGDVSDLQKKQDRIAVVAGSNYNSATGIISFTAYQFPKGVFNPTTSTFLALMPTVGSISAGLTDYTLDVSGLSVVNTGSWEVVF